MPLAQDTARKEITLDAQQFVANFPVQKSEGGVMKAVTRRLHQVERRLAPQAEAECDESLRVAILIRERRRRRLETSGQPFEEMSLQPIPFTPGKRLSVAETLRQARQRAYE